MGHYQTHKANHPGYGHCSRCQKRSHCRNPNPPGVYVDSQAGSHLVSQLENIGALNAAQGQQDSYASVDSHQEDLVPAPAGKAPVQKAQHPGQVVRIEQLEKGSVGP